MKNLFYYDYPIGPIGIAEDKDAVTNVFFGREAKPAACEIKETPLLRKAAARLDEYLRGVRTEFDLPLAPQGTDFQQMVWRALQGIPFGETRSYKEVAVSVGRPLAARAVGMANNRNPIAIIIPCHRVIGQNGALTGYAGGLNIKRHLLDLEKKHA